MSTLTDRQAAKLHRIIRDVHEHHGVEIRGVEDFTIFYEEEYRPGRGHRIRFNYVDGDHAISGFMDVYGDTSLAVGTVDWIHNDSGDCNCSMCSEATA